MTTGTHLPLYQVSLDHLMLIWTSLNESNPLSNCNILETSSTCHTLYHTCKNTHQNNPYPFQHIRKGFKYSRTFIATQYYMNLPFEKTMAGLSDFQATFSELPIYMYAHPKGIFLN